MRTRIAKGEEAVLLQILYNRTPSMKCFGHYIEFDTSDFLNQFGYASRCFYDYLEKLRDAGYLKSLKLSRNHVKMVLADDFPIEIKPFGVDLGHDGFAKKYIK